MPSLNDPAFWAPFMKEAIDEAQKGRWQTAPNPNVGAVLLKDNQILAKGYHAKSGQDHAEVACLKEAQKLGINTKDTTLLVTLEPCNHQGKTPPCTEAIIKAGISRVVIGLKDPNPLATGGIEKLISAGIEVIHGIEKEACQDLIQDFITWQKSPYPFTVLKLAMSLDGRIATRSGHSQWISCEKSRQEVHRLRALFGEVGGAVLIGGKTLRIDNPLLNARLFPHSTNHPPIKQTPIKQPFAACISSKLPDPTCALITQRPTQSLFFIPKHLKKTSEAQKLQDLGAHLEGIEDFGSPNALQEALKILRTKYGCHYVLCEGGGELGTSLIKAKAVHRLLIHIGKYIIGDEKAKSLFTGQEHEKLDHCTKLRYINTQIINSDIHIEAVIADEDACGA